MSARRTVEPETPEQPGPRVRRQAPAGAPWIRTRLRAMPAAALLTALLALVTTFLAAAIPLTGDRGADRALRGYLADAGLDSTGLHASARSQTGNEIGGLDSVAKLLTERIGTRLPLDPDGLVYGTASARWTSLATPGLAAPDGVPPQLSLMYLHDAPAHVRLTEGQWPTGRLPEGEPYPVVLSEESARTLGAHLGQVLDEGPDPKNPRPPQRVRVTGLFTADPKDPFWIGHGCALTACQRFTPLRPPDRYWQAAALVSPEYVRTVAAWGQGGQDFWRLPVDTRRLRADRLADTSAALATVTSGPVAAALATESRRPDLRLQSQLRTLIDQARDRQAAATTLTSVGPAGAAGVAAVVLCLAAALAADRRITELRLLRARGAGASWLARRLLAEGLLTVLPAAAVGTATALLLFPTYRHTTALVAAVAVTVLAWLAFPVRAVLALRPPKAATRRRLTAELVVLAATVAAVTQARRRGVTPVGEGIDPLLVAAPLLLALTGAVLLARLQPLLVGLPARWSARRSGAVTFLGLTRAARGGPGGRPSVLLLLALLLAVGCAAFGSTALAGVTAERAAAARYRVGGDAVVRSTAPGTLPAGFAEAAALLPGVRTSLPLRTDDDLTLTSENGGWTQVHLVAAEPEPYAEVARTAGRGTFDPALLGPAKNDLVPALVSPDLAQGDYRLYLPTGMVRIHTVGTVTASPAAFGTTVPTVQIAFADTIGPPNTWMATGPVDESALRALAERSFPTVDAPDLPEAKAPGFSLHTSTEAERELGEEPLRQAAERTFWAAVATTALYAVLAVLLTLVRAAPERAALLARLRTMGLRPRQGMAMVLAESLPPVLLAAAGGAGVAMVAVLLLGPAVDLSPLVGTAVEPGLRLLPGPITTQALGLAVLAVLAVLAETAVTARRQITTELRAGDR
ncbi:FtsX-like permease family protein [Kitasatospora sp. NPDC101801]|uniref:FtsX-like permease family protein n=1 Tax=Kitasatospora sp. NPDC101801 TaxID=3364103 RepID=UPI003824E086